MKKKKDFLDKAIKIAEAIEKRKNKIVDRSVKSLKKPARKRVISKRMLKPSKMKIHIKEYKPAEYIPLYFKNEIEQEKHNLFFSD